MKGKPKLHILVLAKHEMEGKKMKSYSTKNVIDLANASVLVEEETWMMINHSTLDCHVTFSNRYLAVPERLIDTLTL